MKKVESVLMLGFDVFAKSLENSLGDRGRTRRHGDVQQRHVSATTAAQRRRIHFLVSALVVVARIVRIRLIAKDTAAATAARRRAVDVIAARRRCDWWQSKRNSSVTAAVGASSNCARHARQHQRDRIPIVHFNREHERGFSIVVELRRKVVKPRIRRQRVWRFRRRVVLLLLQLLLLLEEDSAISIRRAVSAITSVTTTSSTTGTTATASHSQSTAQVRPGAIAVAGRDDAVALRNARRRDVRGDEFTDDPDVRVAHDGEMQGVAAVAVPGHRARVDPHDGAQEANRGTRVVDFRIVRSEIGAVGLGIRIIMIVVILIVVCRSWT